MKNSLFPQLHFVTEIQSISRRQATMINTHSEQRRSSFPKDDSKKEGDARSSSPRRRRCFVSPLNGRNTLTVSPMRTMLDRRRVNRDGEDGSLPKALPFDDSGDGPSSKEPCWKQWRRQFQRKSDPAVLENHHNRRRFLPRRSSPERSASLSTEHTFEIYTGENPSEQWTDFVFDSDQEDLQQDFNESMKWREVVQS